MSSNRGGGEWGRAWRLKAGGALRQDEGHDGVVRVGGGRKGQGAKTMASDGKLAWGNG